MEDGFYQRIMSKYNIELLIPEPSERKLIHSSIYEELTYGKLLEATKKEYLKIIESQKNKGSEGIILGCTEIPLLIKQEDVSIPLLDTTKIHAETAAKMSLIEKNDDNAR